MKMRVTTNYRLLKDLKWRRQKGDNPQLPDALTSNRNDFWIRGLLSEPVSDLAGSKCLPELFDALQKNYDEGHDNDRLNHLC